MDSATIGIPNIWSQYMNTKDCSQGLCSLYCPQFCYIVFTPPPPPPPFEDFSDSQTSGPNFSPLIITIIVTLGVALLVVSYYAIISKYCRKRLFPSSTINDRNNVVVEMGVEAAREPWFVATNGLDEAVIKSIAMFEYKRGDGLVEGRDCSVCLSEFVEDERLRLLPKCSHAFHVECIDTWLKCHSNCPLCRASVAGHVSEPLQQTSHGDQEEDVQIEIIRDEELEEMMNSDAPKTRIRRSVSMDSVNMQRSRSRELMMRRSHSSGRLFCKLIPL